MWILGHLIMKSGFFLCDMRCASRAQNMILFVLAAALAAALRPLASDICRYLDISKLTASLQRQDMISADICRYQISENVIESCVSFKVIASQLPNLSSYIFIA